MTTKPMRNTLLCALLSAITLSAPAAIAETDTPPEIIQVTTPRVGATHTAERDGTIAEGFSARVVEHRDAVKLAYGMSIPVKGHERKTLAAGTVLLNEGQGWYCVRRLYKNVSARLNARICFRDRDDDGEFDGMRLRDSSRTLKISDRPYRKLDIHRELVPTDDPKHVLIFKKFKNGILRLDYITFMERPSRPIEKEKLEIALPEGAGFITVKGVEFSIRYATTTELVFIRAGGDF